MSKIPKLSQNKNDYYTIRFRIHKSLVPYFKKKAINKSLNTKDINQANAKAGIIYSKYKEILQVSKMLSDEQIQNLVDNYIVEQLEQDFKGRAIDGVGIVFSQADGVMFPDNASAIRDVIKEAVGEFKQGLANSDINTVEDIGKELLSNIDIVYDEDDDTHRVFMLSLLEGQVKLFEELYDVYSGKVSNFESGVKNINITTPIEVEKIITVQDAYIKFEKWYKQTGITAKQYKATTNKLTKTIIPFLGLDTDVKTITLDDIDELKEFLETFPNISRLPYKNMTFEELINLEEVPEEMVISTDTQCKYLKIVKQFFKFLLESGLVNHNPCSLLIMPDSDSKKREPFTKEDIDILFNEFESLDDRKYIYYTLAYTGMRPSEFWKCKIAYEDEIFYFDLTDKSLNLKTANSKRKIPLHNKLVELGIQDKLKFLQDEFKQASISNYFNKNIKTLLENEESKIMYSFRHTVATELKRADVDMDKISEILGHSYENSSVTKTTYANPYSLQQLKEAIENLEY